MILLLVPILYVVPPSLGLVDCIIACSRCQEHDQEYPRVLEVYCAMCQECKDRRRERRLREKGFGSEQIIYNLNDFPEGCPTPPPCETDLEDIPPHTLSHKISSPSTSTPTEATTSTTRRPCPSPPPCKKRQATPPCYIPCMPMCPCPYPQYTSPRSLKLVETSTASSTGQLYVYIGVPKEILKKTNL